MVYSMKPTLNRISALLVCSTGFLFISLMPILTVSADDQPHTPSLTWTEIGKDSQDSMPLGNGDLGLNVWTEPDGAVLFYIGKSDAWSEAQNSELVKLGRVRIMLTPNPFAGASDFKQTLRGQTAELTVSGGPASLRLWVDANANVIRGEVVSDKPVELTVSLDPWRVEPKGKVSADVLVPDVCACQQLSVNSLNHLIFVPLNATMPCTHR